MQGNEVYSSDYRGSGWIPNNRYVEEILVITLQRFAGNTLLAFVLIAPSLAACAAQSSGAGSTVLSRSGKTVVQQTDGSIVLTQLGVKPNPSGGYDDSQAETEAQEAFAAIHPHQSTLTTVAHGEDGTTVITTRAWGGVGDGDGQIEATPAGPPPPLPPPPAPGTVPPGVSQNRQVQNQNDYTRTTQYDRDITPDANSDTGFDDGRWYLESDDTVYGGGSDSGCGSSGQRPCPQPDSANLSR